MPTSAGELRESLVEAITAVREKKLDPNEAKAIAMLAGQINLSLQIELNARAQQYEIGTTTVDMGRLPLGEGTVKAIGKG